jgi:hypothetical protein
MEDALPSLFAFLSVGNLQKGMKRWVCSGVTKGVRVSPAGAPDCSPHRKLTQEISS